MLFAALQLYSIRAKAVPNSLTLFATDKLADIANSLYQNITITLVPLVP